MPFSVNKFYLKNNATLYRAVFTLVSKAISIIAVKILPPIPKPIVTRSLSHAVCYSINFFASSFD